MLHMETIAKMRRLFFKEKLSQRQIAKKFSLSRTTVAKYLKEDLSKPPSYKRQHIHYRKLGPFIEKLNERLTQEAQLPKSKRLTAIKHFEWLKDQGYEGQYCSLANFIREFYQQYSSGNHDVFIPQTVVVN